MTPRLARAMLLALCVSALPARAALHLMFPYDYLALTKTERYHYLLGVLDARLAPLESADRLASLTRCLTDVGLTRIQHVVETQIIPMPETAVIPMPYLVERALRVVCAKPPGASK